MSSSPPPSEADINYPRSSSFAWSLYQPMDGDGLADEDAKVAAAAAAAAEKSSPTKSSRRMSRRASRGIRDTMSGGSGFSGGSGPTRSGNDSMAIAAAAAASAAFDQEDHISPVPEHPVRKERQQSWYQDALLQAGSGAEGLSAIFGNDAVAVNQTSGPDSLPVPISPFDDGLRPNTDNDEVLEQYKIMAHLDASQRVRENTGFDPTDYEKRRKNDQEESSQKVEYFAGKDRPKPILPEIKTLPREMAEDLLYQPQEPPPLKKSSSLSLTKQRTHGLLVEQRSVLRLPSRRCRSPGLIKAVVLRGSTQSVPDGECVLRCLGCYVILRVRLLAILLRCPECGCVCAATSTRR